MAMIYDDWEDEYFERRFVVGAPGTSVSLTATARNGYTVIAWNTNIGITRSSSASVMLGTWTVPYAQPVAVLNPTPSDTVSPARWRNAGPT